MHSKKIRVLFFIGIFVLLLFGFYQWKQSQKFEYTEDAYVKADCVNITARVEGYLESCFVKEYNRVKKGQILAQIDTTDCQIQLKKQKEDFILALRNAYQQQEEVKQKQKNLELKKLELKHARFELQQRRKIEDQKAVSAEELEKVKTNFLLAQTSKQIAKIDFKKAQVSVGGCHFLQNPRVLAQKEQLKKSYLELFRCTIISPCDGFIAKKSIEESEKVSFSKPLFIIAPLEQVWIEVNLKETQLKNIRRGQEVEIFSDLYGSCQKYTGMVDSVGLASGNVFSLFPPQNATGNWIKVVQRVPIKVLLTKKLPENFPLLMGISMRAKIEVKNNQGSILSALSSQEHQETNIQEESKEKEYEKKIEQEIENFLQQEIASYPKAS